MRRRRWLDALLGRATVAEPDLDTLFALPPAAAVLGTATGFASAGLAGVGFRAAEGRAFAGVHRQAGDLLGEREEIKDAYDYTWFLARDPSADELVKRVHGVNSTLEDAGFGPSLLCSAFRFESRGRGLLVVYLYKRGTFYPFAPLDGHRRDTVLEDRAAEALRPELPVEPDRARWFALWDIPALTR
ncbi:hypothetical protein ACIBG7_09210 [Nonomuraea sp. NPDC050328]|uniref:PspA-associated protein PspAB n=1 Tax=Nonomuraea sp. NPDC050328 TaxID=3364361 RepID=UPI0037AC167C